MGGRTVAWREWLRSLERQTLALYHAMRDPRTPWTAKVVAGLVVAYAVSPVDLIPDFIPVLGLVDDLLLLPLGIWLAVRLIPPEVLADAKAAAERASVRPTSRAAAVVILAIWAAALVLVVAWGYRAFAE